jgi:putative pyruvate formate lyase activating enzyme
MTNLYNPCRLCPRNCGVDRLAGEAGFCGENAGLRLGTAVIHRGEEPPLVGTGGSGTIFVSGCNLGCVFCQNYQISQGENGGASLGRTVSARDFAEICVKLRDKGAENINIVTGSHAVPAIVQGIIAAKSAGVQIPVLWNSSAYETAETLELLRDYVDIYLPDLKTLDSEIAAKFFNAPDYPVVATAAILKMLDMVHERADDMAPDKVIVRHLILPGYLESTREVLRWFADNAKDRAQFSLMTQYTPIPGRETAPKRYLMEDEYETVLGWLEDFNIEDGFCQELVTGSDWLPDFRRPNPFSSELSVPVWP